MNKTLLFIVSAIISLISPALIAQPSTPAPTPPARTAPKVISIFSDAYTNVTGTEFNPNWGQSTVVTTVQIGGNNTLKYANLNYQGTALTGSVNALTMNKLHVDVWTADGTAFQITPISPGPKEKLITLTPLTLNQWNSFDVDLTQFTGVNFSEIFQFKVVGNGTVYIDNLYFYDNTATVDTEAPTAFTAIKGLVTADAVELLMTATDNSGAVNYEITYGTTTVSTGGTSGVQKSYTIGNLQGNTAYNFSITAKDATGNTAANSPVVVSATTGAPVPAAPAPVHASQHVVSVFSDAYTSAALTANYFPGWGQSTVATIVDLGGTNKTLKYTNLNYQGLELNTSINAGTMSFLHLDVYTDNETKLEITPISNTPVAEFLYSVTPLNRGSWNSYNLPLTVFGSVDKTDIFQFKFVGSGGKTVYIDNIYFHDGTTGLKQTAIEKNMRVYPSVATSEINVQAEEVMNKLTITNMTGQTVKIMSASSASETISVEDLSAGHYFITIDMKDGSRAALKFIKK